MSSYPPNPLPGVPTFIAVSPLAATIGFGQTLQLSASLRDATGASIDATQVFSYESSNNGLATVDSGGLITGANPADPNLLTPGGIVQVVVTYPYGNRTDGETMSATATITILANDAISAWYWAGRQGATSLAEAENWSGATNNQGAGKGFRNFPAALEDE